MKLLNLGSPLIHKSYIIVLWNKFSGAPFLKSPRNFFGPVLDKAIFSSSSVSVNGEVYVPKTSCMRGTSAHIQNMR